MVYITPRAGPCHRVNKFLLAVLLLVKLTRSDNSQVTGNCPPEQQIDRLVLYREDFGGEGYSLPKEEKLYSVIPTWFYLQYALQCALAGMLTLATGMSKFSHLMLARLNYH